MPCARYQGQPSRYLAHEHLDPAILNRRLLIVMMRSTLNVGLCFLIPLLAAFAGTNNPNLSSSPSTVIAEVNGKKITLGEFEGKRADKLFQAQNNYYQAERKVLDEFIGQLLLEQQAQRENISVEELLERHVKGTLP